MKTSGLTPGETLSIMRRRLGWTETIAAEKIGVSITRWERWERDQRGAPVPEGILVVARLTRPSPGDLARVLRRRAGLTQAELGRRLGWSRRRIHRAELDSPRGAGRVLWEYNVRFFGKFVTGLEI